MKAVGYYLKFIGYGLLFLIICQMLNGIFASHTIIDLVLGILFVVFGEKNTREEVSN